MGRTTVAAVEESTSRYDEAVETLVRDALRPYALDQLTVEIDYGGGIRFVKVSPRVTGPAPFSVGAEDEETLNCAIGNIWLEVFGPVDENLDYLRDIVDAVLRGHVEEAGFRSNAYGRIKTERGVVSCGAMHLPLPWRLRRVRRYSPYRLA